MKKIEQFFKLKENGTNVKTEVIAGISTFMTMSYIITTNPGLIVGFSEAGTPLWNAVFMATVFSAFFGTMLMALLANKPFALAPGMGLNAFFATVVASIATANGITFQEAFPAGLSIILFSGVLFTVLTLFKIREQIVNSIPKSIRIGIPAGIGLLLLSIGFGGNAMVMNESFQSFTMMNFFTMGPKDALMAMGPSAFNVMVLNILVCFTSLFLIGILSSKKIKGAILYGILGGSLLHWGGQFLLGNNPFAVLKGASFIPPFADMFALTFFKFNFSLLFEMGFIAATMTIITFCMVDMFDTIGTLIGTAQRANMLDKNGDLPGINQALLSDSLATIGGAVLGTSTVTTFIESSAGVEEGGRTGLTSVVTAFLFLACMFLAPVASLIPGAATSGALVYVGVLMVSCLKELDFTDVSSSIPVVLMFAVMPATGHIGDSIGMGLISYTMIKFFTGKGKDVSILTWILSVLFIVKLFLPY